MRQQLDTSRNHRFIGAPGTNGDEPTNCSSTTVRWETGAEHANPASRQRACTSGSNAPRRLGFGLPLSEQIT